MEIDESKITTGYQGSTTALACLLASGVCFINNLNTNPPGTEPDYTTVIYVNLNDVFSWGTAEGECLKNEEIIPLYQRWKEDPIYGVIKWACVKRNEQPQEPLIEMMKNENCWDAEMAALPPNYYDTYLANHPQ